MSNIIPTVITCPRCGDEVGARVFESLNADTLPEEAERVAEGTFEMTTCGHCQHRYQPEHQMLFNHFSAGLWIVMYPRAERPDFATIERGVEATLAHRFADAPAAVAEVLRGVRPRLVFGQRMLTEALRCALSDIDPTRLECAKLACVRQDLGRFMSYGPFELCYRDTGAMGALRHDVLALDSGDVLDTIELPANALALADAQPPANSDDMRVSFRDLYERPYISACRYLYSAAA